MAFNFNKPVFRPDSIPTGLVGYWKFNNDATDSSASGYDLTAVNSPTYVATDYWKSGEYSGNCEATASQYWYHADDEKLDLDGSYTLAGWFKVESLADRTIIAKAQVGSTGYWVRFANGATMGIDVVHNGTTASLASDALLVAGKWLHVSIVFDDTNNLVYFYGNGNLLGTAAQATTPTANTEEFRVGYRTDNQNPYDGDIKDLAIWDAVLTPIQIKSLALGVDLSTYAYRPNHVSTPPTAWWKLNEVSGDRADSSANGYTLTDGTTTASSGGYVEGVSALFSSDKLTSTEDNPFDFGTGDWTVRGRFTFASTTDTARCFVSKWVSNVGWNITVSPNAAKRISVFSGAASITMKLDSVLSVNTWYDLCVKREGNTLKIYIDGVKQAAEGDCTAKNYDGKVGAFTIGNYSTNYWEGKIEDFAIWKGYALTDAEIKSLACALPIQRQGIVSYWKMDEAADATRADSIGSNTLTEKDGATIAAGTGVVNDCIDLEAGDTAWLEAPNSDSLNITSDMCILGWHKPEAINITQTLVDKDYAGDGYGIRIDTAEKVNFYIGNDTDISGVIAVAGTWFHFCGNYDGATKAVWTNGASLVVPGAYTTNPADTTTALRVGSTIAGGDYADGLLDELVLSKRYFRPEEIKAVYLKGLNGKEVTTTERQPYIPRAILI